ncbi:hypothetical protein L0F63_007416 [Massospora cicadina]|nr:hypothetical protein L0F63_007416 [Massospora cicadina]
MDPVKEAKELKKHGVGLKLLNKKDISSGSRDSPLTPNSPANFDFKGFPIEKQRLVQKRASVLLNMKRRSCSYGDQLWSHYLVSMPAGYDRFTTEVDALRQLRNIRSFDDMILNGFGTAGPEEPRALTVAFSLTPPLCSELDIDY